MKRHDTHILNEESDKENKEENESESHQYNFSDSSNESYDSNKNLIKKEPNSPMKFNFEKKNNNDSIISSDELQDIFHGKNEDDINKETIKKKLKKKKNKLFVKLKKVRLNKDQDEDLVEYCLTYNILPRYDAMLNDKYINLSNSKNKIENIGNKNDKNNNNNKLECITDRKIQKNKIINKIKKNNNLLNSQSKEKEILYFFYNDDNEGNKKLKRVINILNKEKSSLYKISNNNCFTIKNSNINWSSKPSQRSIYNNPFIENYRNNGINKYYKKKEKLNFTAKNKLFIRKNKNLLFKENNKNNNLDLSLQNQYGNPISNKFYYKESVSNISNNYNNKDKILYELYCGGKMDNSNINLLKRQRIKSTDSIIKNRQIQKMNNNKYSSNNILEREEYYPDYIKYLEIHNREKENRKIIKNMFRRAGHNFNDFNRHVGNDMNCPICQAMYIKNENSIKIKGIKPIISSLSNNSTQNSWQNRRIYSALSRILTRRQIERSGTKSSNVSHTININKSKNITQKNNINNISNISRISTNNKQFNNKDKNNAFRKLNINKNNINQNRFPKSEKMINFKNKNIKYN